MRRPFLSLAAAALTLLALPALASQQSSRSARLHPEAAAMCRAECLATASSRPGGLRADATQACAVRCAAAMSYLTSQAQRGSAEATGRGRGEATSQPATASRQAARSQRAAPPVMQPVAMGRVPAPARTHGAIYGARTPSPAFGMVVGDADRLSAHRGAERACTAGGPGCRLIAEFSDACGAAAQGIKRSQWALFITSDPNSYVVTSLSAGSGATQQAAERQAVADCRSRDPQANCRIVASACTPRQG